MVTIAIIEDDPAVLQRMTEILATDAGLQLVATAANFSDARAMIAQGGFEVLLCDLGLPGGDGIDIIREVAQTFPTVDVLVVTVFANQARVLESIKAGARGYILKDDQLDRFNEHIHNISNGGSPISPMIARQVLKQLAPEARKSDPEAPSLSQRETEVLNLLARGFSYDEIAGILSLSAQTVPTYVKRLYRKLGVNSRSEAVFEGASRGMIDVIR
jgi:DNA-binding NarL/FixJ family response regulator